MTDGVLYLEDISVFLSFPQLEEQLFEIEPLPCPCSQPSFPEDYDYFLQTLVDSADEEHSAADQWKISPDKRASTKGSNKTELSLKRGRGRPPDRKSLTEIKRWYRNLDKPVNLRCVLMQITAFNSLPQICINEKEYN